MTINGLDLSAYQEDQNRLINWPELAKDSRHFQFVWIKCAEGEIGPDDPGAYPVAVFRRQMDGARSINLHRAPYHFHYFHVYMGEGRYYQLSPYTQANAFREAARGYEGDIPPLVDLEDPYIYRPVNLLDYGATTESANQAISWARLICKQISLYCAEVTRLFGVRPVIYTGGWWWNPWAGLVKAYYPQELAWAQEYDYYLADYVHAEPAHCIGAGRVIAHQYTSTPSIPVQGMTNAPNNVDMARWMLTDEEFVQWAGNLTGGVTMAAIYNTNVPQIERAKILTLEPNQTLAQGVTVGDLGIDGVILPMGSMHNWDGSHWKTLTESTFPGRFTLFDGAGVPVLGRFDVDAGAMIAEGHGMDNFQNKLIVDNFILPKLINSWHVGSWTWESIFSGNGKFRKISALILQETYQTPYNGSPVNGIWQRLIWDYLTNHLRTLMGNKQIPTVPILMYSGGWWLRQYPTEMGMELSQDTSWLYLHLGHWVRFSEDTYNTLADIFAWIPLDTFTFLLPKDDKSGYPEWNTPDGYFERVLLHEWTGQRQKCRQIVDANGNPVAPNLSLWNDTRAKMLEFLGYTGPGEPPIEPPASLLEERVAALEMLVEELRAWKAHIIEGIEFLAADV